MKAFSYKNFHFTIKMIKMYLFVYYWCCICGKIDIILFLCRK